MFLLQLVLKHPLSSLLSLLDTLESALLLSLQNGNSVMQLFHVLLFGTSDLSRMGDRSAAEDTALERVIDATDAGIEE